MKRRYVPVSWACCLPGYQLPGSTPQSFSERSGNQARPRRRPRKRFEISNLVGDNPFTTTTPVHSPRSKMVLKLRLARFGRTNAPFYNIVVAHARYGTSICDNNPTHRQPDRQPANFPTPLEPRATASLSRSSAHTTPFPRRTPTTPRGSCTRTSSWT